MREKAKHWHVPAGLLEIPPSRSTSEKTTCSRTEEEIMKKQATKYVRKRQGVMEKRQKITLSIKRSRSSHISSGKLIAQHPATTNAHIIASGSTTGSTRAYNPLKDLVGDTE